MNTLNSKLPYPWQQPPWQQLTRCLASGRVPHAWIFYGAVGLGKFELANYFAQRLLCTHPDQATPCGQCQSCRLYLSQTHPDCQVIAPIDSRVIKVDQIRQANSFLTQSKQLTHCQVTLIKAADCLHKSAANALLKSLEEPTIDCYIIMTATQLGRLPATLLSRCQKLSFPPATVSPQGDKPFNQALCLTKHAPLAAQALLESGRLTEFDAFLTHHGQLMRKQLSPLAMVDCCKHIAFETQLEWQLLLCQMLIVSLQGCEVPEQAYITDLDTWLLQAQNAAAKKCYHLLDALKLAQAATSLNQQLVLENGYYHWQNL
jgi:DNA polymerase III subunit delta'